MHHVGLLKIWTYKGPFIFYGWGGGWGGGISWVVPVKYNVPHSTLEIFYLARPCSPKYLRYPSPPPKEKKDQKKK